MSQRVVVRSTRAKRRISRAKFCKLLECPKGGGDSDSSLSPSSQLLLTICEGVTRCASHAWWTWNEEDLSSILSFYDMLTKENPRHEAKSWTLTRRMDVTYNLIDYLSILHIDTYSKSHTRLDRFLDQLVDEFLAMRGKSILTDGLAAFEGMYDMKVGQDNHFTLEQFVKLKKLEDLTDYSNRCALYRDDAPNNLGIDRLLKESFERRGGLDGLCAGGTSGREVYLINFMLNINRVGYQPRNLIFLIRWLSLLNQRGVDDSCTPQAEQILNRLLLEDHFQLKRVLTYVATHTSLSKVAVGTLGCKAIRVLFPELLPDGTADKSCALKLLHEAMINHEAGIFDLLTEPFADLPDCLTKLTIEYLA
jgi:hypothetical protein